MKCKDCKACKKGWFSSDPDEYVCIGVKEPFAINDINAECTEYKDKHDMTVIEYVCKNFTKEEIIKKFMLGSCVNYFGVETEFSQEPCDGNCEDCWNSKVEKLLFLWE